MQELELEANRDAATAIRLGRIEHVSLEHALLGEKLANRGGFGQLLSYQELQISR